MQKVVKDNIIYVDKPKMSLVPLVLSAASLLFVALGAASLFYFQKPLQETQDIRDQASVAGGQVVLTSQLTSPSVFTAGSPSTIDLKYNSNGLQLTGIQIVTKVTGATETPTIEIPSNLKAIFQEVEQVSDGYLVSIIVTPVNIDGSISSSTPTTFAKLSVPLQAPGSITLTYDKANSFATVANTNPPRDELRIPEDVTFTIISAGSPSPTPSPTPTPGVTPTPAATPSPSPTPTPVGDDFTPVGSQVFLRFFTNDAARTEVALADLKPNQTYRVRVQYGIQNARKSNTNDQSPIQTAFVVNGQGSSYVTDDLAYSLIANHANGGGDTVETVFNSLEDNTLRITTDSRSAYAESNEGNNVLLVTFDANNGIGGIGNANVCNGYCADSRECRAGHTCFNNQCRRPDNPDSATCAAPSATVVTTIIQACGKSCATNKDCAVNLRCYQGACRLATNPSSLTCSAATAGVITKGSGTGLGNTKKGDVITQPSGSPTSSVAPSSSPRASISPSASPSLLDERPESNPPTSFFGNLLATMQARGVSIPVIAVIIGLILFVLALLFAVLGRTNNRPPVVVASRKEAPKTAYEDELQKKINALKTPSSTPSPATPATPDASTSPTVEVTPSSSEPTMMSRLKERGVLENIPKADQPTPVEPTKPSEPPQTT